MGLFSIFSGRSKHSGAKADTFSLDAYVEFVKDRKLRYGTIWSEGGGASGRWYWIRTDKDEMFYIPWSNIRLSHIRLSQRDASDRKPSSTGKNAGRTV